MRLLDFLRVLLVFVAELCLSLGQSELLKGVVGEAVTFKYPVLKDGFLNYKSGVSIAHVSNSALRPVFVEKLKGRVHWDRETGLFSITQLFLNDTGNYAVQNTGGQSSVTTDFHLMVYNAISEPQLSVSDKGSLPQRPCLVECSVANGREVTLYWHSKGKTVSSTSSSDLNSTLTLALQITGLSDSYSCVASNPISIWIVSASGLCNGQEYCDANCQDYCAGNSSLSSGTVAVIIILILIAILFAILTLLLWRNKRAEIKRLQDTIKGLTAEIKNKRQLNGHEDASFLVNGPTETAQHWQTGPQRQRESHTQRHLLPQIHQQSP